MATLQEEWEEALEQLLEDWAQVSERQREQLAEQIRVAVDQDNPEALAELDADDDDAAALLLLLLLLLSESGAQTVVVEAAAQGVAVEPTVPPEGELASAAAVVTALMAASLAVAAGQEATRIAGEGMTGAEVAEEVRRYLEGLSDRYLRDQLGGALSQAQHAGRMATMAAAPPARYVAVEVNDLNRCEKCAEIDGAEYATLLAAQADYPVKGYRHCQGGVRCRGQVVPIWDK
jgi:hypothetical protein